MASDRTIKVLYFAAASTEAGTDSEIITLPSLDPFYLSSLTQLLISKHPNSKLESVLQTSQWAVNLEMIDEPESYILKGGEEVAVICPVSGGWFQASCDDTDTSMGVSFRKVVL